MRGFPHFIPIPCMPNLDNLDNQFRLTPWSSVVHADFVAGRYGALLQEPARAERYREQYVEKEKDFEKAYELQRTLLRESSKKQNEPPQELPNLEKIDWDPRKRFGVKEPKKEPAKAPQLEKPKTKK